MVRIRRSQRRGPGSIPGVGIYVLLLSFSIPKASRNYTVIAIFKTTEIIQRDGQSSLYFLGYKRYCTVIFTETSILPSNVSNSETASPKINFFSQLLSNSRCMTGFYSRHKTFKSVYGSGSSLRSKRVRGAKREETSLLHGNACYAGSGRRFETRPSSLLNFGTAESQIWIY